MLVIGEVVVFDPLVNVSFDISINNDCWKFSFRNHSLIILTYARIGRCEHIIPG